MGQAILPAAFLGGYSHWNPPFPFGKSAPNIGQFFGGGI
jgi:hypothetical protein